jgi:hypothetical protein
MKRDGHVSRSRSLRLGVSRGRLHSWANNEAQMSDFRPLACRSALDAVEIGKCGHGGIA